MISAAPSLAVFMLQGGFLTNTQHNLAYVWPPSQVPDFAIGVVPRLELFTYLVGCGEGLVMVSQSIQPHCIRVVRVSCRYSISQDCSDAGQAA